MTSPWVIADPMSDAAFADVRRRAIFDCNKWDPQVGDVCVVARSPLVLTRAAWTEISSLAAALAREALAAERELIGRPDLHRRLGLPSGVRRGLRRAGVEGPPASAARIIRFDFHYTPEGWRISEANADVPGGLNEASGFPLLVAPHYPWAAPVGDPAEAYVDALLAGAGGEATIALVHATAYSDDQQMMAFLARRLAAAGALAHLASPSHVHWRDGRASLASRWWRGPLDLVVRFFPGDWLPALPGVCGWTGWFAGGVTPVSNPASALLVQTKRFPLVWDDIGTPLPTWRARLPETRDPSDAPWQSSEAWIVKPALGRVGEGVRIAGLVDAKDSRDIARDARRHPRSWIAQRRFELLPIDAGGARVFPCVGVYTVGERVVGAYGRLASRPLIDSRAEDAAVLIAA
jgi:hypothetical protein